MPRGSREYGVLSGFTTSQISDRVGIWHAGSMNAVSAWGISTMSDSWISWNPRMEDPSNPRPSVKMSSFSSLLEMLKCCQMPGRSMNFTSTTLTLCFLANSSTSFGVMPRSSCDLINPLSLQTKNDISWPHGLVRRRCPARSRRERKASRLYQTGFPDVKRHRRRVWASPVHEPRARHGTAQCNTFKAGSDEALGQLGVEPRTTHLK